MDVFWILSRFFVDFWASVSLFQIKRKASVIVKAQTTFLDSVKHFLSSLPFSIVNDSRVADLDFRILLGIANTSDSFSDSRVGKPLRA